MSETFQMKANGTVHLVLFVSLYFAKRTDLHSSLVFILGIFGSELFSFLVGKPRIDDRRRPQSFAFIWQPKLQEISEIHISGVIAKLKDHLLKLHLLHG